MEIIVGAAVVFLATASLIYFLMWFLGPVEDWYGDGDDFFQ